MKKKSKSSVGDYAKELMTAGPKHPVAQGLELSLSTILGKTLLRRLPVPLNFAVPLVTEKIIIKHGVPYGRDVLIKALRWVKEATEEKNLAAPAIADQPLVDQSFGVDINR